MRLLLLLAVFLSLRNCLAQEVDVQALQQSVAAFQAQITSLTSEKAVLEKAKAALENELTTLKSQLTAAEGKVTSHWADLQTKAAAIQSKEAEIAGLKAELERAKVAGAEDSELKRRLEAAEQAYLPLWAQRVLEQVKQHAIEIKNDIVAGDTGKLGLRAYDYYSAVEKKVKETIAWVDAEIDEHAPGVKAAAKTYYAQGCALFEEHVSSAQWWKSLVEQVSQVEKEVRQFITANMKKVPLLEPYSDPVLIQFLVYVVFATPVMLIVFPLLAWCLGSKRPPSAQAASKNKKKKAKAGPSSSLPLKA